MIGNILCQMKLPETVLWVKHVTSCLLQGFVFPGYEPVPVTHVHLLLVLCHRRHGHCNLHLQIHRILWVSG